MRTALFLALPLLVTSSLACSSDPAAPGAAASGAGGAGGDASSTSSGPPAEGPPRYFLRIDDSPVPDVVLDVDKQKALQLFGEGASAGIHLLDVDTTKLLANVLAAIQNACGTGWKNDSVNPMHDCSLTPLGQSFGPGWKTSPEFAMVRLLGMTPANANVTGTSLEDFAHLFSDNPGLFTIDFSDVLAESLGVTRTSPFIPTDNLIKALQKNLLATHPNVTADGKIQVSLLDGLLDLATLADKMGPIGAAPWDAAGSHPGILVPDDETFQTKSDVLLPTFHMRVNAHSNLRWVDGIDLSGGLGEMFVIEGNAPLSFDFEHESGLVIEGVADAPTVDMRFSVEELDGAVPACVDPATCKKNYPLDYLDAQGNALGAPVGDGTVWKVQPFLLEPVVSRSALLTYGERVFSKCYVTLNNNCLAGASIGAGSDPPGWTIFKSDFQSVTVPPPQFLWELLDEVAQVALHDPTGDGASDIAEGHAKPVFALHGVDIGMSGEEIVAAIRPNLAAQSDKIASVILGKYWKHNGALDFYYRRGEGGGAPYLFFAAETDLRPDPQDPGSTKAYTYAHPGFFTSPDLAEASRVSAKTIDGLDDTTHEKYRLPTGDTTLYVEDDEAAVYEVHFYVPDGADPMEITAEVKKP